MRDTISAGLWTRIFNLRRRLIAWCPRIRHVVLVLHYRCNLRCPTCSIWQTDDTPRLSQDDIQQMLRALPRQPLTVQFTGGEPLLRDDFLVLYRKVEVMAPGSKKTITTNGTLPERLQSTLEGIRSIRRLHVTVSLNDKTQVLLSASPDTQGQSMHRSLTLLQKKFPEISRSIKIVLSEPRLDEVQAALALARKYQTRLELKFLEMACAHTNPLLLNPAGYEFEQPPFMRRYSRQERGQMLKVLETVLAPGQRRFVTRSMRQYVQRVRTYLSGDDTPRRFRCPAPGNYVMMQPDGRLCPCRYSTFALNIQDVATSGWEHRLRQGLQRDRNCLSPHLSCLGYWNFFV